MAQRLPLVLSDTGAKQRIAFGDQMLVPGAYITIAGTSGTLTPLVQHLCTNASLVTLSFPAIADWAAGLPIDVVCTGAGGIKAVVGAGQQIKDAYGGSCTASTGYLQSNGGIFVVRFIHDGNGSILALWPEGGYHYDV